MLRAKQGYIKYWNIRLLRKNYANFKPIFKKCVTTRKGVPHLILLPSLVLLSNPLPYNFYDPNSIQGGALEPQNHPHMDILGISGLTQSLYFHTITRGGYIS